MSENKAYIERIHPSHGWGRRFNPYRVHHYFQMVMTEEDDTPGDDLRRTCALPAQEPLYRAMRGGRITLARYNVARGVAPMLYFVAAEETAIKIGIAHDVADRLHCLQVGCPLELRLVGVIPTGAAALERELHSRWRAHRIRGEWFRPAAEITDYIAANKVDYDAWLSAQNREIMNRVFAAPPKAARGIT